MPEPRGAGLPRDGGDSKRPAFTSSGMGGALTIVVAAAVLYVAHDIFVPLAIAGLLTFVLSPPMLWLRHHGLGRTLSAIAVVTLAFIVILGFGAIVVGEVASLTKQVPSYQPNIEAKLQNLREDLPIDRLIQRGTRLLQELRDEMSARQATLAPAGREAGAQTPVPVEIQTQTGFLQVVENYIGPVLKPLTITGLVLVFVIFFLLAHRTVLFQCDRHRTTIMRQRRTVGIEQTPGDAPVIAAEDRCTAGEFDASFVEEDDAAVGVRYVNCDREGIEQFAKIVVTAPERFFEQ